MISLFSKICLMDSVQRTLNSFEKILCYHKNIIHNAETKEKSKSIGK
jgi:hypothetical protein